MSQIHFDHNTLKLNFYFPSNFLQLLPYFSKWHLLHPPNCTSQKYGSHTHLSLLPQYLIQAISKSYPFLTDKICMNLVISAHLCVISGVQAAMTVPWVKELMLHFPFLPSLPDDFPHNSQSDLWLLKSNCVIPLLKSLQWLVILLRINSQTLKVDHSLPCLAWSNLCPYLYTYPVTLIPTHVTLQSHWLPFCSSNASSSSPPRGLHSCASICLEQSSLQLTLWLILTYSNYLSIILRKVFLTSQTNINYNLQSKIVPYISHHNSYNNLKLYNFSFN